MLGTWLLSQLFSDCSLIVVAFASAFACDKLAWLTFVRCCHRRRRCRRLLLFFNKLVILLNYSSSRTPPAHHTPSLYCGTSKLCLLALAAALCDYIGLSMWRWGRRKVAKSRTSGCHNVRTLPLRVLAQPHDCLTSCLGWDCFLSFLFFAVHLSSFAAYNKFSSLNSFIAHDWLNRVELSSLASTLLLCRVKASRRRPSQALPI